MELKTIEEIKNMRTSEVAQICGVTDECIRQNAKKVGIVLENGKVHDWTEEELKKIQMQLMKNGTNRGASETSGGIVEANLQTRLEVGLSLQLIMQSGNVEACKELCQMITEGTQAQHDLMIEQQKNKLLIEQKEALQKEVDKYVNWKSAKEIKLEFKLPVRPGIEKVAMLLNLKEGEDWIARLYDEVHPYKKILYSPEAVERIVEYIR